MNFLKITFVTFVIVDLASAALVQNDAVLKELMRKMPGLLDGRDGDEAEDSLHHVLTPGNQNNIAISDDGDGEQQIDGGGDDNDDDEGLRSGVDVNKRYSHLAFSHLQAQNSDRRAMKKLLKMLFQKRSAPAVMKRSEASINSQYRQLLQLPQHHPHMKAFLFLTQDIPEDVITEYLRDGDIVYQE